MFFDNNVRVSRPIRDGMGHVTLWVRSEIHDRESYLADLGKDGRTILKLF